MLDFIFRKNHLVLDATLAVILGSFLGEELRRGADSGMDLYPDQYIRYLLICGGSCFVASIIATVSQRRLKLNPSFTLICILAPLSFGIAYRGLMSYEFQDHRPVTDIIIGEGVYALFVALAYFVAFIPLLMTARCLLALSKRIFQQRSLP